MGNQCNGTFLKCSEKFGLQVNHPTYRNATKSHSLYIRRNKRGLWSKRRQRLSKVFTPYSPLSCAWEVSTCCCRRHWRRDNRRPGARADLSGQQGRGLYATTDRLNGSHRFRRFTAHRLKYFTSQTLQSNFHSQASMNNKASKQ